MSDVVTTIDLLRHGEPQGGRKFRGTVDDPLSAQGWAQMRTALGDHNPWGRIVSSPSLRCAAFARELSDRHGLPLDIEPGFQEIAFGIWEGRDIAEVHALEAQALGRFWRDPVKHPPPGGEALDVFHHRVTSAWRRLLERHHGQHVLLACHGGTIRVLLSEVLGFPLSGIWRLAVPYAALSRVCIFGQGAKAEPQLLFHAGALK